MAAKLSSILEDITCYIPIVDHLLEKPDMKNDNYIDIFHQIHVLVYNNHSYA